MFKLESYITPIILNHVAKYVKNIRPEDSQVSLWEGEVAFQNLDLRLDVLEEELNLPFEFLSGHVHELLIQVPWMKIASEPIKITINTIEFVLKLKKDGGGKMDGSPAPKKPEKKRVSRVEEGGNQQQQGYMPGLVNKIINNIVINCHNIILKYVEEDIVVSMNIQLLSFSSADESWKPAFTDINPVRVFMRKLVQVSDLTICLDKRNAAGQIDVCQEPILYRCSLEIRIVRKYNVNILQLGSTTKIAIFTKLMEINVSSLQFPMAMRLFKLILALKDGELKSKSTTDVNDDENDIQESAVSAPSSYLSWAWSFIPSFNFSDPTEEEKFEEDNSDQLLDIGIYIEALNFTLKHSEFITDSIVGATKKIRYSPIVKLMLRGLYSETVIVSNKNWSNTKGGLSSIAIEPLDAYRDEESEMASLVTTPVLKKKTFLDRSLFDEGFIEKDWSVTSIDEYNVRVTEDYLLYRSPVFAFDLVEYQEAADEDAAAAEVDEIINRSRVNYRILAASMTLRYNQTYSRIAAVIEELIRTYDYLPYSDSKPEPSGSPKLHPPLLDDFDSLMTGIPLKVYKFQLSAINFECHPKAEPLSIKSARKNSLVSTKKNLPYFRLSIEKVEGQWATPMDPDKLVHTTCQLPDKPIELLNACYENAQIRFKNISLNLKQQAESFKLFHIPKGCISFGDLLQASLWKNEEVPMRKIDLTLDSVILEFSKLELITTIRLLNSVKEFDDQIAQQISQLAALRGTKSLRVRNEFKKISMDVKKFSTITMFRGSLKSLQSDIVRPGDPITSTDSALLTTTAGPKNKWLEWYLQIPNQFANENCPRSVLALWMDEYALLVNESLVEFLNFMEPELPAPKEQTPEVIPTSSRTSFMRQQSQKSERQARRICYPEETIHFSSERDERVRIVAPHNKDLQEEFSYSKMLPFIKSMVVKIQIAKGNVNINSASKVIQPQDTNFTQITLPRLIFSSASAENIDRFNVQNQMQQQNVKSTKDTFPWSCGICDFSVQSTLNQIIRPVIHPIQTSITIAMTHKKETLTLKPESQGKMTDEDPERRLSTDESSYAIEEFRRKPQTFNSLLSSGRSTVTSDDHDGSSRGSKKSYLQEAVESVFVTKRRWSKDVVSISLHMDTSPIHMEFDAERTKLTKEHLSLLLKVISLLQMSQNKTITQQEDEIQIVTSAEENACIKQFLEIDSSPESSILSLEKASTSKFVLSFLLQWTITRFTVELDASKAPKCKLVLDMEDLISSVDKRDDFTKFTSKIGTLNTRFFETGAGNEPVVSDRLRIKMQPDSTQSPLFNLIYTTVGVNNFFKKIGAKRKETNYCRAISEIIIKMEAMEIIVDVDKVAVLAPAICAFTSPQNVVKETEAAKSTPPPCTASQLPLIHLDSKGFTVYIPTETRKSWCSVSILKVGSIKISPNLENPLQRCPVRADVFQKAAQMGILGTPGSIIEDRQYEVTLGNISAATGNWNEILAHMKEHTDNFHNTNPAFEWNNQSRKTSLDLRKIFSNFTFITTYAPCITCNNVLICGQAIEFNCSNDLVASLTTDQLTLFSCIIVKVQDIIGSTSTACGKLSKGESVKKITSNVTLTSTSKQNTIDFLSTASFQSLDTILDGNQRLNEESSERPITDSGFSSGMRSVKSASSQGERKMPHTMSLVAGMFVINLQHYRRSIIGIPQGDEPTIVESLTPLVSVTISQPSFHISQTIYEVTRRFSLFNLAVNLYHEPLLSVEEVTLLEENPENIPEIIFDTKRGEVDSSGIPPPLLVLKSHTTKSNKLEIDLSISKPAIIRLTEKTLKSVTQHVVMYYEALLENPCFNIRPDKPLFRATKIQMMKNIFFHADRFNIKIDMFKLKFSKTDKYSLTTSLVDMRCSAKFLNRPEKMNAKASIGGFYVKSNHNIVVHPIGAKCNVDFVQESWNRLPLVTANIKFNMIRCDVGVEIISNSLDALKVLNTEMEVANNLWEEFLFRRIGSGMEINRDRLLRLVLPEVERKKPAERKEEFYQDDLRAGAFQFVEMVSDAFLPMPYQIQIIKKNYGIICWRYPQPRGMSNIHIFPVPMAVPNPIRIKCRMEYFSDAHEGFLHYCDFWLSETVSKSIELPERDVTAHIWRVVILQSLVSVNRECFDTSEEDEELRSIISIGIDDILNSAKKESDFILHPKVLVGCMRIDTVFRPSAIPKFQLLIHFKEIQLNLQNHQNINCELPRQLKKFKIAESDKPIDHTFLSIIIEKTSIHTSFHALNRYSVHSDLTIAIKCLDYGYLNLIYITEQINFNAYFKINDKSVDSSIVADKLSLNLGPSVLHNLICAKENWEIYFKEEEERRTFLISKFIIVNRTQATISFGQTGTSERIALKHRECCKYSFLSEYSNQEITFYVPDGKTEQISASVVISLDFPANSDSKVNHVPFDTKCLIVRTKRLSATQYYILIKGQIELISMVNEPFLLEFYRDDKKTESGEIHVDSKDRTTFLQTVTCESNICIRLRIEGPEGKGQTGNIPLKSNKNYPWLVKVPIAGAEKFISYWVRIVRECIAEISTETYHPQKILITIWPIFEIRSMMTCPIMVEESSTHQQIVLAPNGKSYELKVPATHMTDHSLSFLNEFKLAPNFNLTLKAIDWNKFFWYDEKVWSVEKTISELSKPNVLKWPLSDDEELRIRRTNVENTNTSFLYKCAPSREFSCTLSLEVAPWGTFINATGQQISVQDCETCKLIEIPSNAMAMLPTMKCEFIIGIQNGQVMMCSLPIIFDKSVDTMKRRCYRLDENDSTDIVILKGDQIFKFHLQFCTENERNIFVLKPKYVIANMTKQPLVVLPFALDHKETVTRKDITDLADEKEVTVPPVTSPDNSIGISLDGFYDSNATKAARSTDSAFMFFVCVKIKSKSEISIPMALMHPFNRKCFSLQAHETSIPLSASLLEKGGQYFVSIFEDNSPMILFHNQTDLTLIVAQTINGENTKVSKTIPEYDGRQFEWYQVSRPRSILYYTPPTSYANFPDVEQSVCNLSIALYNENHSKKNIKWSNSIHTDETWEKFLHVPAHGDVKVSVCDKHRIIRVSIFYIAQQLEFSVKDLRSRLLTPQSNDSLESSEINAQAMSPTSEPLQRVKPSLSSECIHKSTDRQASHSSPIKVRFSINEININIFVECKSLDYLKKEIFALYIDEFMLTYDNCKRELNLQLANLQIDNQLFSSGNYDFPVVLCSQELYKRPSSCTSLNFNRKCDEECLQTPMVEITAIFYDDELKVRSIACNISPIRAYIEDTYLNDLLDYLVECAPSNVVALPNKTTYYVDLEPGEFLIPKDIVDQALYISEPLKMQYFRINSVNVMLSVHTCVRLYIALDHSPLQFSTYERQFLLTLPLRFGHTLGMHYLSGALFGAGWVVGSLEMLGSPSGLARSFSVGLKDFISMPVQGLLRGPWGFVVGVTQGSASLLRNITAGTVNSVTKLAASVSRNLDRLTLDAEHIQRTEALRRCRPQGFTEGFTQGITGLGISILGAVGGFARHTLEARSPAQVVTGMGKGIVGAFAKPISGAAELLALTGQGVLHTVGFNAMPQQRAPSVPRNLAVQVSEQKVWNVLLSILSSVLEKDQILFCHDVTLVSNNEKLRAGTVFLTSSVLALFETESCKFSFINPSQRLDVTLDASDKTLVHINVKKIPNELEEDTFYTTQRIMTFLQSSSDHIGVNMTTESLDDILKKDPQQQNRSFYISEHLGQYLIEYLKILNWQRS